MANRMVVAVLVVGLASGAAQAALHDRGGGLVYDDVLDVTWLADANYAKTGGYSSTGALIDVQAVQWAENLSYYDSVRGITYDDWRLPTVRDGGLADYTWAFSGTDHGYNVRTVGESGTVYSELAYMYYVNLGFRARYDADGNVQSDFGIFGNGTYNGVDLSSYGERDGLGPNDLIVNLQSDAYWSGTPYAPSSVPAAAWLFNTDEGEQDYSYEGDRFYAWAVRDGDVAVVPEPASAALFVVGLAGLALLRRRGLCAS